MPRCKIHYIFARYEHDGSEVAEDSFTLSVSDGVNVITETVPIVVELTTVDNVANDAAHHVPVILVYPLPDSKEELEKDMKSKEGGASNKVVSSKEDPLREVAVIHAFSSDREGEQEEIDLQNSEEEVRLDEEEVRGYEGVAGADRNHNDNQDTEELITPQDSFGMHFKCLQFLFQKV